VNFLDCLNKFFPLKKVQHLFSVQFFQMVKENKCPPKNLKKFTVEETYRRVSGSKFEWATSIGVASRKLKRFNKTNSRIPPQVSPQIRIRNTLSMGWNRLSFIVLVIIHCKPYCSKRLFPSVIRRSAAKKSPHHGLFQ
jgi:hypothetical protein